MIRTFLAKIIRCITKQELELLFLLLKKELQEINNKISALKKAIQQTEKFNNITISNK